MLLVDAIRSAARALLSNKTRSLLTVLGIVVGIAAVVCMVSIGWGARAQVAAKLRTLGANLLLIKPEAESVGAVRLESGTLHTLTHEDALALRRGLHDVRAVAPIVARQMQLVAGNKNWSTLVAGIDRDYLVAREWNIKAGRSFSAEELAAGVKVALIGSVIAEELFAGRSAVGERFRIDTVPFTVIGVLEQKGLGAAGRSQDDVVFIPIQTAKSRVLGSVRGTRRNALDFIMIKTSDQLAMPRIEAEARVLLRKRHHLRGGSADDFTFENPADVLTAHDAAWKTLGYLLISVASVSLIVGGISIMNVMLAAASERTREIGLRMALGAGSNDILRQFLTEAIVLSLIGGLLGAVIGSVGAILIGLQTDWPVLISVETILLSLVFASLVGVAFGLFPAYRASRVDPIVALRNE